MNRALSIADEVVAQCVALLEHEGYPANASALRAAAEAYHDEIRVPVADVTVRTLRFAEPTLGVRITEPTIRIEIPRTLLAVEGGFDQFVRWMRESVCTRVAV